MKIVNVKCPGCGASIQLDADRETGFCSFCGSTVKVQEAIQKIKFDNTDLIKNNLILAETALESKEYEKCVAIADKVLEADTNNSKAWLLKLKGLTGRFQVDDTNMVSKVQVCLKRLIAEQDKDIKDEAIGSVLSAVNGAFIYCAKSLLDMRELQNASDNWFSVHGIVGIKSYLSDLDRDFINMILALNGTAMGFIDLIPSELFNDPVQFPLRKAVAENYINNYAAFNSRTSFYGAKPKPDSDAAKWWEQSFNRLVEGLPEDTIAEIKKSFQESSSVKKKGCLGMFIFLIAAGIGSSFGVVELIKSILA